MTIPPGDAYDADSPVSGWSHRLPGVVLALCGCGIAAYLAAYQSGAFAHVWEPIFGNGSERILHSSIAKLLPIPDAGLGAAGYLVEAIAGAIGGEHRWRSMPWIVLIYGAIVALFAAGSVVLVLAQLFYFHAGCTLCLASALISFCIAARVWREPLASLCYVLRRSRDGGSFWQALRGEVGGYGNRPRSGAQSM